MFFIGEQELTAFILSEKDYSLSAFLEKNRKIVIATNVYNSLSDMKSIWKKRYSSIIEKSKPESTRVLKQLLKVDETLWKSLYEERVEQGELKNELFACCGLAFEGKAFDVELLGLNSKMIELEKKGQLSAKESLIVMATKMLKNFNCLDVHEKSVLKLAVSDVIDISNDKSKKQFGLQLPSILFDAVCKLEPKESMGEKEVLELQELYDKCYKVVFADDAAIKRPRPARGVEQQILYIFSYLANKFDMWEDEEAGSKRKHGLSEFDLTCVVEEILNAMFADVSMIWKGGERVSDATKKAKIASTITTKSSMSCKNVTGRKSDLILYDQQDVAICLSELKDGNSGSSCVKQRSKSIRCNKMLKMYNKVIGGSDDIWSLNWDGQTGYTYCLVKYEDVDVALRVDDLALPNCTAEMAAFKNTLVALYKMKAHLVSYQKNIKGWFEEPADNYTLVYNSP